MSGGYTVRDLPRLTVNTTSTTATNAVGSLDDATSITIFLTSSATSLTSGTVIQITQHDPAIPLQGGVIQSTGWHNVSSSSVYSSGSAIAISNISFRGLRLSVLASANVAGEVIAYISKQIYV